VAESTLAVTAGSGTNLRTNTRTIAAVTVHEQAMLFAEGNAATYTAIARAISTATSTSHLLAIQGDGTNYCRVRRITIRQAAVAGAANTADIRVFRTSTAGTGGTAISARPFDAADTNPYAGDTRSLPTSAGTVGDQLLQMRLGLVAAQPINALNMVEWRAQEGNTKPIIFGSSTSSGIAVRIETGIATSTVDVEIEFVVTSYI
jgi:hypothetical protein